MTSTETMESMFQLQGEIDMLNERVHKLEKMFESKPVKVNVYHPNTELFWSIESGAIMSKAEWGKDWSMDRLEYVGTAKENGYEFKSDSSALDDIVMETFLFHKEARRSRI